MRVIVKKTNGELSLGECHSTTPNGGKIGVTFSANSKEYQFNQNNVDFIRDEPEEYSVEDYHFFRNGDSGDQIFPKRATKYYGDKFAYWELENKKTKEILEENKIYVKKKSLLCHAKTKEIFDYMAELAELDTSIRVDPKDHDSRSLLGVRYDKIKYLNPDTVAATYLGNKKVKKHDCGSTIIFPFGCNQSQRKAVENALSYSLSVIEGPPGTGKTQTILNIIANLILQDKNILIISNNNSATLNVKEKLEKYNLGFIVATLGKKDNKKDFKKNSANVPSELNDWKSDINRKELLREVTDLNPQIEELMKAKTDCADKRDEIASVKLEYEHYLDESDLRNKDEKIRFDYGRNSNKLLEFLVICENYPMESLGFLRKLQGLVFYGIPLDVLKQNISDIINEIKTIYYRKRIKELNAEISKLEHSIESKRNLDYQISDLSMKILKDKLYEKYGGSYRRKEYEFYNNDETCKKWNKDEINNFLKDYPVILSTTFSATSSLPGTVYDYVVMDEASQCGIASGALALTCAKNAVIVGDSKQLHNIITEDYREKIKKSGILEKYEDCSKSYKVEDSFLESVVHVSDSKNLGAPKELLKEHYRCHPKIINFCNKQFYNGELTIMTTDNGEETVLNLLMTKEPKKYSGEYVNGNGETKVSYYNQREIDTIEEEILDIIEDFSKVGITSPFNAQITKMQHQFKDRFKENADDNIATIHKFQGKEKEIMILSMVDTKIDKKKLIDDPNLINVAVSRAVKQLWLVLSINELEKSSHLAALKDYIQYQKGIVKQSNVCSIFDYINRNKADYDRTMYDSPAEQEMEKLIKKVIEEYYGAAYLRHYPLRDLLKDSDGILLSKEERDFVKHASHVDFMIYSSASKQMRLCVEVDGVTYHSLEEQKKRDRLKDEILRKYDIPLIRFETNGSKEEEKLKARMDKIFIKREGSENKGSVNPDDQE